MNSIIKFFVKKTLFVNLLTIFILVIGFLSLKSLNRESYPNVDRKRLYIATSYPGASPSEVENGVAIPLEDTLDGIDGIKEYTSTSVENFSRIRVVFDDDLKDVKKVKNDIRRAIDSVDLPSAVTKKPHIYEWKVSAFPILELGLFSDKLSYAQLRVRVKDLKKKISRLYSVSSVDEKGILDREVKIKLKSATLDKYYLSLDEIIQAIRSHNIDVTAGIFHDGHYDKVITVFSKFKSLEDVKKIVIRSTFEGEKIFLGDIAEVVMGFEKETSKIRFNGQKGISLSPHKKENADIIKTTDAVRKVVKEYKKSLPEGEIHFVYLWTMDAQTKRRLKIVNSNALIGLLLVLVVLIFFMHFKNAFWTAFGIPVSIAFAMIFLKFFGVTLNSISLLGFIVVMGMVVDDAIVISENIYRHKLTGLAWGEAAVKGTKEVALPVITTVLTTIVAFLPLYQIKGMIGDFVKEIPLVIILVLAGSLFEALFILSNHISHSFRHLPESSKPLKEKKFIIKMQEGYSKLLAKFLNHSWFVVLVFTVLLLLSLFVLFSGKVLKYVGFPSDDTTAIYVSGKIKDGQNLDYTSTKMKPIEQKLGAYPKSVIKSFSCDIGSAGHPENFNFIINLTSHDKRKISANEIITNIKTLLVQSKSFTNFAFEKETGGPPTGRAVEVKIVGNNNEQRRILTDKFRLFFEKLKGTRDFTRSDEENKPEIKILVDNEKAARLGCSPSSVGNTIRAAFNGVVATTVQNPDEVLGYRVLLDEEDKNRLSIIKNLQILNNQNKLIALSELVSLHEGYVVNTLKHYNGDRATIVSVDLDKKIMTPKEAAKKIKNFFKILEKEYPGFQFYLGGEAKQSRETIQSMINAAIVAVLLIFFALILLFKSLPQSLLVLMAIPFSFIGVALALLIHNMVLSAMALFGMVGLAGVVVNDSLVMVDYINVLRKQKTDKSMKDLILQGASTRLRPVLLTTITTVAGLLPTAYGLGGRDSMIIPTTIVIAWGLVFSTTLTLFLIPTLYLLHVQIHNFFKKLQIKIFSKKIILIFVFLFFAGSAFSEVLPFKTFMSLCTKNNPEIFKELNKIKESDAQLKETKSIYDIVFGSHYFYNYNKPFSDYSADKIKETTTHNLKGDLQFRLPYVGTRVETGIDYNNTEITIPPPLPSMSEVKAKYYNPVFYVNLTQPLLKNWFGLVDSYPLRQAKLNKLIVKETVTESLEQINFRLCELYLDWYAAYQQKAIYEENVQNSEKLVEQITKKYKLGLSDKSELSKVKIMNIEYVKGAEYYNFLFKSLMFKIQKWTKEKKDFIPEEKIHVIEKTNFDFSTNKVRQIQILHLTKQLLVNEKKVKFNSLLPELNFSLSYKKENYSDDIDKMWDSFDYKDYTYGLILNYPIGGGGKSKGEFNEAKTKLLKWQNDYENFVRNYEYNVYRIQKLFQLYKKRLKQDKTIIHLAKMQLSEEEKKYKQGRSDLFFVIQHRNDLLNYRLTYLQDLIELNKILIQMKDLEN